MDKLEKKQMLSLKKCREILNSGDRKYTDEQVAQIRDHLYLLAHLEVKEFIHRNSSKSLSEVSKSVS